MHQTLDTPEQGDRLTSGTEASSLDLVDGMLEAAGAAGETLREGLDDLPAVLERRRKNEEQNNDPSLRVKIAQEE